MTRHLLISALLAFSCFGSAGAHQIALDELDLAPMSSGWGQPRSRLSVGGTPLAINGKTFLRGVGTHALSSATYRLEGAFERFEAYVGVDSGVARKVRADGKDGDCGASVKFLVFRDEDEEPAVQSPVLRVTDDAWRLSVDLRGAKTVELFVCDAADGTVWDHADWADAFFVAADADARVIAERTGGRQLGRLTPRPCPEPRINGPRVYGVRPGHPVIYRLPVTGEEPLAYSAEGLPRGLAFDAAKGILTGSLAARGDYPVVFTAKNARGEARATVTFRAGDTIALTPPMGWNHWNCFSRNVTAEKILAAADAMDRSELARHGYSYVNIDDFWQNRPAEKSDETLMGPERQADGAIAPNRRFPSMKAVADAIHARGFRAGLYSSPGPLTCGGCTGSWRHEWTDARAFAAWGYDLLKYDWCSYSTFSERYGTGDLARMTLPFLLMGEALRHQDRDIVFSLCQYGMHNVSAWGARCGGQTWRTTHDIMDVWERTGETDKPPLCWFRGIREIIDLEAPLWPYAGPGAWNDADMLAIGTIDGFSPRPTRLTPNEQYTHVSFWCILCSPLLVGCDLTKLDDFTLGLLCNDEVLATNYDPLGAQAARVARSPGGEIWAKPMSDGSIVFALLNPSGREHRMSVDFAALGLRGEWKVRDLWRQRDYGLCARGPVTRVPSHATVLYRCWPAADAGLCDGLADIRMNWVYSIYGCGRPVDGPAYLSARPANSACANCPRSADGRQAK